MDNHITITIFYANGTRVYRNVEKDTIKFGAMGIRFEYQDELHNLKKATTNCQYVIEEKLQ